MNLAKAAVEHLHLYRPILWLQKRKVVILMYHGLTAEKTRPDWTLVQVEEFERQMEYLKSRYQVLPLKRILKMAESKEWEPFTAAVTFDDGYRSVYDLGYPILRRYALPATVFVTTGFVTEVEGEPRYMWPDHIGVLLDAAQPLHLDLTSFGFGVFDLSSPQKVFRARCQLVENLKRVPDETKENVLCWLQQRFGSAVSHDRHACYHPMSWKQVSELARDELMTIGGHTRTHPILSQVNTDRLKQEILGGKQDLEARLKIDVAEFAYPNGRPCDFDARALDIVRSGFQTAVTTVEGLNTAADNPYLFKRMGIGSDLRMPRFKALLSGIYSNP